MAVVSLIAVLAAAESPTTAEAPPQVVPPIDYKPIGYFNDNCGNCHGNYGSFWGEGFVRGLDDAALRAAVKEMADGPAQAPLEDKPLAALVAYHRSLADGSPFVIVTRREGDTISGETTPGATVVIQSGGQTIPSRVEGHTWSAKLDAAATGWSIIATRDKKTTRLPSGKWHSHKAPGSKSNNRSAEAGPTGGQS